MRNPTSKLADLNAVVLINYLRRHHVSVFKEIEKHVGKLTILTSTPMEDDRSWAPEWEGLDVRVQKNFTLTLNRSSGFREKNFLHFPYDSIGQLRRLRPDIVFSYEMGMRSLLSYFYKRTNMKTPLVLVGNMSYDLEVNRKTIRNTIRKWLVSRVDHFTYNGPSCQQYLEHLGIDKERQFFFPYCYDTRKVFHGDKTFSADGVKRFLYCGALSDRKGILPFTQTLAQFCDDHPGENILLEIAGTGQHEQALRELSRTNLKINLLGNCTAEQIKECYGRADFVVFPSFGDEWGLVPVEAWASGIPVIGSELAQSVSTYCKIGQNGWMIDPQDRDRIYHALLEASKIDHNRWSEMSAESRNSVAGISAKVSAEAFCEICVSVLQLEPSLSHVS